MPRQPASMPRCARECLQVAVADAGRVGEDFGHPFEAAKQRRVAEREVEFRRVERVEEHDFVLLVAEVLQPREDVGHVVEQIAEDERDAAAAGAAGEFVEHPPRCAGPGYGPSVITRHASRSCVIWPDGRRNDRSPPASVATPTLSVC